MVDSPVHFETMVAAEGSGSPQATTAPPIEEQPDTQKLIGAMKIYFDELRQTNIELSKSLTIALEGLTRATESKKGGPQSIDEKNSFWTLYKKLSDEFDKEFRDTYGEDLNNVLIFAGLFSAVSSAFIIQIQPEFQVDPNVTSTEPAPAIVVAQSLLYFSLFATLFAALLAVLGKQWLLYYDSVGEKGTIEERGRLRQRKYDALGRWKFSLIMEISPFLLQFALLVFAAALSVYLWTIHHILAALSLALTSVGFILYIMIIGSALVWKDAPFQTTFTNLLLSALTSPPKSLHRSIKAMVKISIQGMRRIISWCLFVLYTGFKNAIKPLLPLHHGTDSHPPSQQEESTSSVPIFSLPESSADVNAIIWALETSTEPKLVEAAAAIIPEFRWPVGTDLRSVLKRLADLFNDCFQGSEIRPGMLDRATRCIRAFALVWMLHDIDKYSDAKLEPILTKQRPFDELAIITTVFQNERGARDPNTGLDNCVITQWALRVISAPSFTKDPRDPKYLEWLLKNFKPDGTSLGDISVFSDFLFCVNSFFTPPDLRDLSLMDKSKHCGDLITLVFQSLSKHLAKSNPQVISLVTNIFTQMLKFDNNSGKPIFGFGHSRRCRDALYGLCASPLMTLPVWTSALQLVRVHKLPTPGVPRYAADPADVRWISSAFKQLGPSSMEVDSDVLGDFLQVVVYSIPLGGDGLKDILSLDAIPIVLKALHHVVNERTRRFAYRVLCSAPHWFQDNKLLQDKSIWTMLTDLCDFDPEGYIFLGGRLSTTAEWKLVISHDPSRWLLTLPSVLYIYKASEREEGLITTAVEILAGTWAHSHSDWLNPLDMRLVRLIRCTVRVAFCAQVFEASYGPRLTQLSQQFKYAILPRLGVAVEAAADTIDAASTHDRADIFTAAAGILRTLAVTIKGELKDGPPEDRKDDTQKIEYWRAKQRGFEEDIEALRRLLEEATSAGDISVA
ncbi:hypothetical protein FB451DRAFT_1295060 [Mycena latifolia]|nr:hypothetical protein FB451DRAFT_1295060 [Mycena latifolia]